MHIRAHKVKTRVLIDVATLRGLTINTSRPTLSVLILGFNNTFSHVEIMFPLDMLSNGETARVIELDGDPDLVVHLREIGLEPGVCLRMVRSGSPCIIAINHQRLTFRSENAASVFVEPVGEEDVA
ncbi:MAG: ferrous iron transport protein A [Pirellulaceae bacterium]